MSASTFSRHMNGVHNSMEDLIAAMEAREYPLFQSLVDRTELDLMKNDFYLFRKAVGKKDIIAAKILLSSGKLDLANIRLITFLIKYGSKDLIQYWMSLVSIGPDVIQNLISISLELNRPDVADMFRKLFSEEVFEDSAYTKEDLISAAKTGDLELIQHMVDSGFDPSVDGNEAMYIAFDYNQYPTVEYLEEFDPRQGHEYIFDLKNRAIQLSDLHLRFTDSPYVWNKAVDFVSQPRIPSVLVNYVFQKAVFRDKIEFLKRLWSHPKIDLAANNNINLLYAVRNRNMWLIEFLSENPYVRDGDIYTSVKYAVAYTNPEVIQLLVERFDFDLSQNNNDLLMVAAKSKNYFNLKYILSRPGIRIDSQNYKALSVAARAGNVDSVTILLNKYRHDPNFRSPEFMDALRRTYNEVTDALASLRIGLSTDDLQSQYRQIQEILRTVIEVISSS